MADPKLDKSDDVLEKLGVAPAKEGKKKTRKAISYELKL